MSAIAALMIILLSLSSFSAIKIDKNWFIENILTGNVYTANTYELTTGHEECFEKIIMVLGKTYPEKQDKVFFNFYGPLTLNARFSDMVSGQEFKSEGDRLKTIARAKAGNNSLKVQFTYDIEECSFPYWNCQRTDEVEIERLPDMLLRIHVQLHDLTEKRECTYSRSVNY